MMDNPSAIRPWVPVLSDIFALIKPRITLLSLITTAAGMYIAPGAMNFSRLVATLIGTLLLVGGASALNMFLEREIDLKMERTRLRPLADQRLTPEFGLGFGSLMIGLAIPFLMVYVNFITGLVGLCSLVIYVLIYTPLKQKTALSLLIGAIPGAAPPLLGWTAATGQLSAPGWILFGIVFLWQVPHFLAIGTFRREEYANAGFKIFPLKQRPREIKAQMLLFTALLFPTSLSLATIGYAGSIYKFVVWGLNLLFLGTVLWGIRNKEEHSWGHRVFLVSLVYLTFLFAVLFLDGGPQ